MTAAHNGRLFAVVTNVPTPYRLPLFAELERQLATVGDRLLVLFAAVSYARRQWDLDLEAGGFRYKILGNRPFHPGGSESAIFSYRGMSRVLRRERPAAVLTAGFSAATSRLWLARQAPWRPYLIWSGTIANRNRPVPAVRRWHRRRLVASAAGFVAYGSRARDYLVALGAAAERVEIAMNTVDTTFFAAEAGRMRSAREAPSPHRLLYVGNLTAGKRLDRLLAAIAATRRREPRVELTIVGDGPRRSALEEQVQALGLGAQVHFAGFRQPAEIPGFLAAADLFLFPSAYDVWGLVLVEAMAAGLPCLSSPEAGATADLVRDGDTGFAVDFEDSAAVAARIDWLLDRPAECRAMGARAQRLIEEEVTLAAAAAACVRAFHRATESKA